MFIPVFAAGHIKVEEKNLHGANNSLQLRGEVKMDRSFISLASIMKYANKTNLTIYRLEYGD